MFSNGTLLSIGGGACHEPEADGAFGIRISGGVEVKMEAAEYEDAVQLGGEEG